MYQKVPVGWTSPYTAKLEAKFGSWVPWTLTFVTAYRQHTEAVAQRVVAQLSAVLFLARTLIGCSRSGLRRQQDPQVGKGLSTKGCISMSGRSTFTMTIFNPLLEVEIRKVIVGRILVMAWRSLCLCCRCFSQVSIMWTRGLISLIIPSFRVSGYRWRDQING